MLHSTPLRIALMSVTLGLGFLSHPMLHAAEYDNDTLKKALLKLHERYETTIRENNQLKTKVDTLNKQATVQSQRQINMPASVMVPTSLQASQELERLKQQLNMAMSQKVQAELLAKQTQQWQTEAKSLRGQLDQLKGALEASENTQHTLESQLRQAQNTRKMLPNDSPNASLADGEINGLKERLVALKTENNMMRDKLKDGAGLSNPAMQNRLELATTELKKAAETIGNQQRQISSLSERIEALQSIQMGGAITLTGQSVDPDSDTEGLQELLGSKQDKLKSLQAKMASTPSMASGTPAGGAVPLVTPDPQKVVNLIQEASALRKQGEWTQAEKILTKALGIAPKESSIHYNLGNIYMDTNNSEKAKNAYAHAIALKPTFSEAHYNLGVLYQREGNVSKAKQFLNTFVQLTPNATHADSVKTLLDSL